MGYAKRNLRDIEDAAARHGLSEMQEARFPAGDLGAEQTGLAYIRMKPDQQPPFAHRHESQEELYLVLHGSGRVLIDGEPHDVRALDAIRVAAPVSRAFESGQVGSAAAVGITLTAIIFVISLGINRFSERAV